MEPNKPPYIDPAGDFRQGALPVGPPFVFRAVTSRVFPLKANIARLSGFCDQYLNMDIPPSIAHFRPSLPYVYLMVLNYGSMAAASVQAQNLGWVSQYEMTFTVPLERWREEHGRLVFKDWACVSPFIFVSDELSLTTGREVYGWPKVAAQVDADIPLWTTNPQSGERLFSLSSCVFPKLYAGKHEVPRVLLQIDRAAPPTYSAFPPDPNNPWNPLTSFADAARACLGLTADAMDMLLGSRMRGYRTYRSADSMRAMVEKASGNLARLLPDLLLPWPGRARGAPSSVEGSPRLAIEQITLKQFRAVEDPNEACYQALVTSRMGFDRLNQAGLLGDVNLLRGDPSGGFTVRIHRYASQPIIESLGLDVVGEYEDSGGASVALLKPTLPFWTDVDLHYDKGRVICSRTSGSKNTPPDPWRDEQAAVQEPRPAPATSTRPLRYNTALGAATQPVCGPFTFPDVTLQVYPLLADRAHLGRFVDRYLNEALGSIGLRFKPCGAYVYMLVSVCDDQLGSMWSSSNNIGWWAEREVTFSVPVKLYRDNELVSLALLTPFVYASSGRAVISDREVNGRPAVAAAIDAPPDAWLTRSGPVAERSMLRLATEIFPALNLGQRAEQRTLLEIDQRPILPYNADVEWRLVAQTWGVQMVEELKRKTSEAAERRQDVENAKALALELLANRLPFNSVILKQHRDAAQIDRTCYQAVVQTGRSITRVYDAREIETTPRVRVYKAPGHPIVETLGLVVTSVDSIGGSVVQNLQPVRPFWMRVAIEETLGKVIAWRAADEKWTVADPWFSAAVAHAPAADAAPYFRAPGETAVGPGLGQPLAARQNLADQARRWLREALAHELAWIRVGVQASLPAARAEMRERLPPEHRNRFDRLQDADPFLAFCDAMPTEAMVGLVRALVDAGVGVPPLPPLPPPTSSVAREKSSDAALIGAVYDAVEALPPERRTALELTLPPAQRAELERLRTVGIDAYCATPADGAHRGRRHLKAQAAAQAEAQAQLFLALEKGLDEWAYHPAQLQRLTRAEASETIERLDEIQLVVESILSDEWENWGDPRWFRGAPRKPEQCVPVGSVYGGSAALMAQMEGFENEHRLKRFEGAWWYVDPPAPQGTGN